MASTVTRKRARTRTIPRTRKTARPLTQATAVIERRYLVDEHGKRIAVVLDLAEYRRLVSTLPSSTRASAPAKEFDWIAEARRVRALTPKVLPDSTPILRALRDGTLR